MKVSFRAYFTLPALLCIVIVALCVALMPIPARAHTVAIAHTHALAQGHVTIIVLDMSGSMEMNDHDGLRCSAANAYIDLSGPGDLIGVIGLDNKNNLRGGSHNFQRSLI